MKTQEQIKRGFVVAAKLISAGVFRVAAAAVALLCAADARGQGLNPAFNEWRSKRTSRILQEQGKSVSSPSLRNTKAAFARNVQVTSPMFDDDEPEMVPIDSGETGFIPPVMDYSYLGRINFISRGNRLGDSLPAAFDARTKGWITPIKQQRPFGTCWAHAAIACMEASLRRESPGEYQNPATPDLSENNLVCQSGFGDEFSDLYDNGGTFDMAMAYLSRWEGPVGESQDPYPKSAASASYFSNVHAAPLFHVQQSVMYEPKRSSLDHDNIRRAVMQYGSAWVSYCAFSGVSGVSVNGSSTRYTFPFLSEDGKSFYNYYSRLSGGEKLASNHAVLLVGWDDSYPRSKFVFETDPKGYQTPEPPGDGAYLVSAHERAILAEVQGCAEERMLDMAA